MKLKENTILITGGSSGIGLALMKQFHHLGNRVIIAARDIDKLAEVKKSFPAVDIFPCDLTRQTDMDALTAFIKQRHPGLNVLINNAAVQYNYDFLNEGNILDKIDYEINANFTSTVKLCALLLPVLITSEPSAIVNISSGLAISPKKSAPVYCGTKAAVHNFTKALRYQLELTGIKVFEILPPLIDTPMTEGRGKNKISAEQLVREFIRDFKNDRHESYIGKTKLLKLVSRLSPKLADQILKNG